MDDDTTEQRIDFPYHPIDWRRYPAVPQHARAAVDIKASMRTRAHIPGRPKSLVIPGE